MDNRSMRTIEENAKKASTAFITMSHPHLFVKENKKRFS